jgi:hypothetical protein
VGEALGSTGYSVASRACGQWWILRDELVGCGRNEGCREKEGVCVFFFAIFFR